MKKEKKGIFSGFKNKLSKEGRDETKKNNEDLWKATRDMVKKAQSGEKVNFKKFINENIEAQENAEVKEDKEDK